MIADHLPMPLLIVSLLFFSLGSTQSQVTSVRAATSTTAISMGGGLQVLNDSTPTFIGQEVTAQAVVLTPFSTPTFVTTNALTMTIR